ncbi:MAG: CotH kinase family protein, partial [Limisphaerales bacterium]
MPVLTAYNIPLQVTPLLGYLISCVVWMNGVMEVVGMEGSFEDFYSPNSVQKIHLSIDAADLRKMKEALPERIYVPATMRWRDLEFPNVGVRFKGDSSSQPQQTHKRSYLIKFSHYETDQRFLGMERVALDNGVQFGSLFSEPIVTEILRDLNIPASHCNHAQLFLNGE